MRFPLSGRIVGHKSNAARLPIPLPAHSGVVAAGVLLAGLGIAYRLMLRHGRRLLEEESVHPAISTDTREANSPAGFRVGAGAVDFELVDLNDRKRRLSDWRGSPVLLVFLDPDCEPCHRVASALAAHPTVRGAGTPIPVVVTVGAAQSSRSLAARNNLHCPVLLQEEGEVMMVYQVHATPAGCIVDKDGMLQAELVTGVEAVLDLVARAAGVSALRPTAKPRGGSARDRCPVRPSTKREWPGLPGKPAPPFRLPGLTGEEISLTAYRGKRVLLIFTQTECEPCRTLLQRLPHLMAETSDLQVVMIARGDREAIRESISDFGALVPVAIQPGWDVSREYGLRAAPVAFLIDSEGRIAVPVAIGVEAIAHLIRRGEVPTVREMVPQP